MAVTLGLAGCSSQGQSDQGATSDNTTQTDSHNEGEGNHSEAEGASSSGAEVAMIANDSGTHFEPHVVQIKPGEAVTWTLKSGSHTTTAYVPSNDKPRRIPDDAKGWNSGTLTEQGATFEHTFETEGVYDYYCASHESAGMLGSIVVGDPNLDDQPGMTESQSELSDGAREKISELNEIVRNGGEGGGSDEHSH